MVGVTREQKIATARKLRESGLTYREIGERFGVGHACVWKWLHPDVVAESNRRDNQRRAPQKRAYAQSKRAACEDCGTPLSAGSSWPSRRRTGKCRTCWELDEAERIEPRRRQIEEWWAEGLSLRAIAERLGWSRDHLSVEIHRMREAGYAVPYRNRGYDRFPDQVAA